MLLLNLFLAHIALVSACTYNISVPPCSLYKDYGEVQCTTKNVMCLKDCYPFSNCDTVKRDSGRFEMLDRPWIEQVFAGINKKSLKKMVSPRSTQITSKSVMMNSINKMKDIVDCLYKYYFRK